MNNCIMVHHNAQKKVLQNVTLFGKNASTHPSVSRCINIHWTVYLCKIRRASLVGAPTKHIKQKNKGVFSPLFCGENEMPFGKVAQASSVVDDGDNLVPQFGGTELENGILDAGGGGLSLEASLDSSIF